MKMTFQEIRIIATGPCIANQLRDVNTICSRNWGYINGRNSANLELLIDKASSIYLYVKLKDNFSFELCGTQENTIIEILNLF